MPQKSKKEKEALMKRGIRAIEHDDRPSLNRCVQEVLQALITQPSSSIPTELIEPLLQLNSALQRDGLTLRNLISCVVTVFPHINQSTSRSSTSRGVPRRAVAQVLERYGIEKLLEGLLGEIARIFSHGAQEDFAGLTVADLTAKNLKDAFNWYDATHAQELDDLLPGVLKAIISWNMPPAPSPNFNGQRFNAVVQWLVGDERSITLQVLCESNISLMVRKPQWGLPGVVWTLPKGTKISDIAGLTVIKCESIPLGDGRNARWSNPITGSSAGDASALAGAEAHVSAGDIAPGANVSAGGMIEAGDHELGTLSASFDDSAATSAAAEDVCGPWKPIQPGNGSRSAVNSDAVAMEAPFNKSSLPFSYLGCLEVDACRVGVTASYGAGLGVNASASTSRPIPEAAAASTLTASAPASAVELAEASFAAELGTSSGASAAEGASGVGVDSSSGASTSTNSGSASTDAVAGPSDLAGEAPQRGSLHSVGGVHEFHVGDNVLSSATSGSDNKGSAKDVGSAINTGAISKPSSSQPSGDGKLVLWLQQMLERLSEAEQEDGSVFGLLKNSLDKLKAALHTRPDLVHQLTLSQPSFGSASGSSSDSDHKHDGPFVSSNFWRLRHDSRNGHNAGGSKPDNGEIKLTKLENTCPISPTDKPLAATNWLAETAGMFVGFDPSAIGGTGIEEFVGSHQLNVIGYNSSAPVGVEA